MLASLGLDFFLPLIKKQLTGNGREVGEFLTENLNKSPHKTGSPWGRTGEQTILMDTGVGGGTKAESDKPAYVIGPRRLGVLMAVAHKPGLSDSAEIFTSKKRRRPIPARRTACPGLDLVFIRHAVR